MKDQRARQAAWKQLAVANDFNGVPPGGRAVAAGGSSPREPTLTEKFNAASKKPVVVLHTTQTVTKKQADAIQKMLSNRQLSLNFTPYGSANNAYNPQKDKELLITLTAIVKALNKQKGLSKKFSLAEKKGALKQMFNRNSSGMSM